MATQMNLLERMAGRGDGLRPRVGFLCKAKLHLMTPENTYVAPTGHRRCRPCQRATDSYRHIRHREERNAVKRNPEYYRRYNLARFHLTDAQYDAMLQAQGGGCAICRTPWPGGRFGTRFMVDHDHNCCPGSGSCGDCVRGLLCSNCNISLGNMRDDPVRLRAAADYLEAF